MQKQEKESWEKSTAAFRKEMQQMFDSALDKIDKQLESSPSLYDREILASALGAKFGELLLASSIFRDKALARILEAKELPCPRCQTLSVRELGKDGKERKQNINMATKAGKLSLADPIFRCPKCRRKFSPLESLITLPRH